MKLKDSILCLNRVYKRQMNTKIKCKKWKNKIIKLNKMGRTNSFFKTKLKDFSL